MGRFQTHPRNKQPILPRSSCLLAESSASNWPTLTDGDHCEVLL